VLRTCGCAWQVGSQVVLLLTEHATCGVCGAMLSGTRLGSNTDDPLSMYLNDFCTVPMPLAGVPAISIPSGLSDGLPVGFQLTGPAFSENRLLGSAYALEQAIGFDAGPARRQAADAR
jgi:Asp-tRNA(Asn)/Glu-tRNA(Gln) amidotransferase A subunit family amidase